jgi:NADH dehydrogenase
MFNAFYAYRLHIAALHGYVWMVLEKFAHWLRRTMLPRVKPR